METVKLAFIFFACISTVTIIVTAADKINSKSGRRRIPEDFLLTLAVLGGALPEYIIMKTIRHKTRHKKFMIGLPLIIILQIIMIAAICIYTQRG